MQIARFWGGLKREIQDQMKMLNTFTFGQAFDLARKAEEPTRAPPVQTRFTNQQFQAGPSKIAASNEPVIDASGVDSRPRRVTPQQTPNPYVRPMPALYNRCHQPRHISNQGPQRPAINFVEGDYTGDDNEYHEAEIIDGIEDDGEDDLVGMIERQSWETKPRIAEGIDHSETICTLNVGNLEESNKGGFESYLLSRLSWCRNPLNLALARHRTHQHTGELCNQRFWLILSMLCMWLEVIKRGPVFAQASHERLLAMFRQGESMQLAKSVSRGFGTTTTQMSTCMLLGLLKKVVSSFALFCFILI
ncbi:hypothetical protein LWI28_005809 [Acer negundo]|uniref:Uncharacterized protein n=1 Tax=Acer negundo TaxID=4023 RepID=A0AAD5ISY1_ACENE|nr:hypothetical protein LWI28_005809 [Acer negundo]